MKRLGGGTGIVVLGLVIGVLEGCGQDNGYLYEKKTIHETAEPADQPAFELTDSNYTNLTWIQQCPTDPMPPPVPGHNQMIIDGAGPFHIFRERMFSVPVVFQGKVCKPRGYDRDTVILIDVTGSEYIIDPYNPAADHTCRR